MSPQASKLVVMVCVLVGCLRGAATAVAAPAITGTFPVKGIGTNNKLVAGPDGNVWVTLSTGKDVARITPAGEVQEYELEEVENAVGITLGPDGNLWVVSTNKVTRFAATDPENTDKTFPNNDINNNAQIVTGPDGNLWVASEEKLVHFSSSEPTISKPVAVSSQLSPRDIDVAGPLIAVADFGGARIATFAVDGTQQDFKLAGGPQGVAGGPGGQMAFSQQAASPEEVGLINPPSSALGIPIDGDPFGVAFGGDGAFWLARAVKGELIRLSSTGQVTTFPGLPTAFFLRQLTAGPNNTIWVTMENPEKGTSAVAKVSGVEPAPTNPVDGGSSGADAGSGAAAGGGGGAGSAPPETTLGKVKKVYKTAGKRAKVKIRFSSAGATGFQCSLTRLKGRATKAAPFKACPSPRTYNLRPGRYRFQVQALNGAVADPSPAVRGFKVVRVPR